MDITNVLLQHNAVLHISPVIIMGTEKYIRVELYNSDYVYKKMFDAKEFSASSQVLLQMIADEFEGEVTAGK